MENESKKIKLFKNKKWEEVDSFMDYGSHIGKDLKEILLFYGFHPNPGIMLGLGDLFDLEIYEWSLNRERALPYEFFGALQIGNLSYDIVFENWIDLMDFIKEYSQYFELMRKNELDQVRFQMLLQQKSAMENE